MSENVLVWSRRLLSAVSLLIGYGCVCPPCEAPGAAGAKAVPVVPVGGKLVIWDGEGGGLEGGKSWADCDKKGPPCKATLGPAKKLGYKSKTALKFHGEGEGWQGGGWNWFGWWPETAGTDIRPYTHVSMWIRVVAKEPELLPEPGALSFSFGCSTGKKGSSPVNFAKYEKNLLDGEWHQLTIPLNDFYVGKEGQEFDPGTAWEFRFNHWAGTARNYDILVDNITVEKKE